MEGGGPPITTVQDLYAMVQQMGHRIMAAEGIVAEQQTLIVNQQTLKDTLQNLQNPVVTGAPAVQPLLGEPAGTVLRNGKGDIIIVDERMFIHGQPVGTVMSEADKPI